MEDFFSLPDFLSSGEKDFKGEVESDGFRLQKRVQHLERNLNWAIAKGTIIEKNDFLIVDIEIKGIIFKLILGWMVMLIAITIFILINIISIIQYS